MMGATPALPSLESDTRATCLEVATRLAAEAHDLATAMTNAVLEEVAEYRALGPAAQPIIFGHSIDHINAVIRTIRDWTLPTNAELAFVRERGALRASQQVPLSALLHSYRLGHRTVWERLVRYLAGSEHVVEAALALTALTLAYTDLISGALAEGYTEQQRALLLQADRAQRDVLERILQGGFDRNSETARLAAEFALVPGGDYLVVVVNASPAPAEPTTSTTLTRAAENLKRHLGAGVARPFVVVRHAEITAVAPLARARAVALAQLVRQSLAELRHDNEQWYAGISTVCAGLADVARGYQEARMAAEMAVAHGGVCALLEVRVSDYLLVRADETAVRMIPPDARQFLQSVHADDRLLVDTLRALLATDLSVAATAELLAVHPNTVSYRLRKIGQRLGRDMNRFSDIIEVLTWLRIVDQFVHSHNQLVVSDQNY